MFIINDISKFGVVCLSEKTIALIFLLGTLCLAALASIMFPEMSGLP